MYMYIRAHQGKTNTVVAVDSLSAIGCKKYGETNKRWLPLISRVWDDELVKINVAAGKRGLG